MKTEVAGWLNNYISPATGTIAYDASLSIQGAAADAKAAGQIVQISTTKPTKENNRIWVGSSEEEYEVPTMDEFNDLKADLDENVSDLKSAISKMIDYGYINNIPLTIEAGRIRTSGSSAGQETSSKVYIRNIGYIESNKPILFARKVPSVMYVLEYNSEGAYQGYKIFPDNDTETLLVSNVVGKKFRITFTNNPQEDVRDKLDIYRNYVYALTDEADCVTSIKNRLTSLETFEDNIDNTIDDAIYDYEIKYNEITQNIDSTHTNRPDFSKLTGKTVNFVGDSVTYNAYFTKIEKELGIVANNLGVSSSTIAINNHYLQNQSIVEKVCGLNGNTAYSDADIWVIMGGLNDMWYASELGDISSTENDTVYGALKSICDNIRKRTNNPILILCTPNQTKRNGEYINKLCKAIKDVAGLYGCPVADVYSESGICPSNLYNTTSDGVHPTVTGEDMLYPVVAKVIVESANSNSIGIVEKTFDTMSNAIDFGFSKEIDSGWKVGFISSSTGQEVSGTGAIISSDYLSFDYPVVIRKIPASICQLYDYYNGSFTRTGIETGTVEYHFIPEEGHTYKFCFYRIPQEMLADLEAYKKEISVAYDKDSLKFLTNFSSISGIRWATLGDSLTDPVTLSVYSGDETKNYADIVSEKLGLTLSNLGVSGSGYWRKSTTRAQKGFYQVAPTIPADTKIVTVFGSFNDMGRDGNISGRNILGTIYDEGTSTVGGCINQTFLNIFARVPDAVVGVILPTPWNAMTITADELATYEAYINLVKGVAERYSLPVLDLFHHSNLRPWSDSFKTEYFLNVNDGTHPNHYGHMRISGMIADFVESLAKGL